MRPETLRKELPSAATVKTYINNAFVDFTSELNTAVSKAIGDISALWDCWTAEHTSDAYLGLMVQWIDADLEAEVWVFRDEVAACHKVLGDHKGPNLGRYLLALLDRTGVTSRTLNKRLVFCLPLPPKAAIAPRAQVSRGEPKGPKM